MTESSPDIVQSELTESGSLAVTTHDDIHMVIGMLETLHGKLDHLSGQLERLIESHNGVGQNMAWLVQNTQGIFKMFSDPQVINQMMSGMMGGMANGGQSSTGTDAGTTG